MKNLTWQNPEQLFVAQELINKVKSKCCGIKVYEDIYQALLLNTTAQSDATANEDVEVSSVTVIAGNGQITVAGAAGKKVVITNILGQTVANTVVTSDNATIAAPAGVVVVAIEGEDAVKAIVK